MWSITTENNNFSHAIVCVNEDKIFKVVKKLINLKVKNILVEKPGGANLKELKNLNKFAIKNKININVAYNRRYYENIIYLKKIFGREKVLSAQFSTLTTGFKLSPQRGTRCAA